MWRVIADFADLYDGGYVYHAGDNYPRSGKPDPHRVEQLSGRNNRRGIPLIESVAEEAKSKKTDK